MEEACGNGGRACLNGESFFISKAVCKKCEKSNSAKHNK